MEGEFREYLEKAYRESRLPLPIHPSNDNIYSLDKLNLDNRTDI